MLLTVSPVLLMEECWLDHQHELRPRDSAVLCACEDGYAFTAALNVFVLSPAVTPCCCSMSSSFLHLLARWRPSTPAMAVC